MLDASLGKAPTPKPRPVFPVSHVESSTAAAIELPYKWLVFQHRKVTFLNFQQSIVTYITTKQYALV